MGITPGDILMGVQCLFFFSFFLFSFCFSFLFCLFSRDFLFLCQLAWWLYRTANRLERWDTRGLPVWRLGQRVSIRRDFFQRKVGVTLSLARFH
ncbi:hypothetical protein M419DRAFT_122268 [Trichoderma reesei RUT C-30]|uniref:Uncharacterized protein n=1 Tax=Hypocrea jecorina (strain ATCC 56765 / BCRC 32924 / NRRL 11460 / Rut C-30) TaxID=1344414 RepID=A0A024SK41_HYPJR|nr:hypothetical protein M419DRAFT_122268 [Trichoderma reesei RUT C-30]